jgi:hypothetical protein
MITFKLRKLLYAILFAAAVIIILAGFLIFTPVSDLTNNKIQTGYVSPSSPDQPSNPSEVTITESMSGKQVDRIRCDASCGSWVKGSCIYGKQYLERLCNCKDTGEKFYESKEEPASC